MACSELGPGLEKPAPESYIVCWVFFSSLETKLDPKNLSNRFRLGSKTAWRQIPQSSGLSGLDFESLGLKKWARSTSASYRDMEHSNFCFLKEALP